MNILPSRRYNCEICGAKYRRSNAKQERERSPICPVCEKYKLYREYVQPNRETIDTSSSYKALLLKYQDLVNLNNELEESFLSLQNNHNKLRELSQAVINRWETPLWKEAYETDKYIYALRSQLDKESE